MEKGGIIPELDMPTYAEKGEKSEKGKKIYHKCLEGGSLNHESSASRFSNDIKKGQKGKKVQLTHRVSSRRC